MIVVVTPNPAVDITYRVARQRIGETQRVVDVVRRPGGKGLNVNRVLAAVGSGTHAVLPLGGAPGTWVADELDAIGIAHTDVALDEDTRTTVTVVDDVAHPTMFGEPGPAVTSDEWGRVTEAVRHLCRAPGTTALVVSGSLPPGTDPTVLADWIDAARDAGVPSIVDCAADALLAAASAGATVCKPNREELLAATGSADERSGALALLERGAGLVVVSRGAHGIAAHTRAGVVAEPAVPGVRGNPTGAGDAATAGLVTALVDRGSAPEPVLRAALRSAAAFGAAAVLRPVAGEVDPEDVRRFTRASGRAPQPAGSREHDHDHDHDHHHRTGSTP
ncbi:hexose kinase [Curtobacterium sp. C1]|uniref:1-phosphofructokinase family hexose kinase n=1 Tax=Curtobacterium sp. C1 TaxID=2898151 RepID=UPI001E56F9D7|nr:hexose kinase [Curtobacterium sp. C1]UFU14023.1 hexose kinase [Curtobacterium sp. C1]